MNLCVHTSSRVGGSCCFSFSFHVIDKYRLISRSPLSQFFPCTSPRKKEIPKSLKLQIDYFDFDFLICQELGRAVVRRKLPNKRRADGQSLLDFLLLLLLLGVEAVRTLKLQPTNKFHNNTPYYTQAIGENCRSQLIRDSSLFFFFFCKSLN